MIEFYVSGQSLKFFTPVIAADTLNYLTAKVSFTDEQWDGYSKWLHFRQDEELGAVTYDIQLNDDNEITAEQKLNLTIGQWEIYLTGTKGTSRLTTVPVILTVKESGLIDAPLHELPLSVAEQVDYNAQQALLLARTVKDMADAGEFDGKDGTSLAPIGHFSTPEELAAIITNPVPGDVYSVGEELPYDLYAWDGINLVWRNHGQLQGAQGERGEKGVTFIPSVSAAGNITWTNDGGLENPEMRNIMGPKGDDGEKGDTGPGAYEKAQEAGYTGTEQTFYQALTMMPYHNRRHLPDGADPITVENGNIKDGAVNRSKLDKDVKNITVKNILIPDYAWLEDDTYALYPYRAAIELEGSGLDENYFADVSFAPNTSNLSPQAGCFNEGLYVYAEVPPEEIIEIGSVMFTPIQAFAVENEVFASISVKYQTGKTCTCTDGVRISTAKTKSGRWTFAIPYAGSWAISDGENEQIVNITTQGQAVSVVLDSTLWLYKDGNEYENTTGGWSGKALRDSSDFVARTPNITKNEKSITLVQPSGDNYSGVLTTGQSIDLSRIKTLYVKYDISVTGESGDGARVCFLAYTSDSIATQKNAEAYTGSDKINAGNSLTGEVLSLDVSSLESGYVAIGVNNSNQACKPTVTIHEVWGD